jgi:hypothetical protein
MRATGRDPLHAAVDAVVATRRCGDACTFAVAYVATLQRVTREPSEPDTQLVAGVPRSCAGWRSASGRSLSGRPCVSPGFMTYWGDGLIQQFLLIAAVDCCHRSSCVSRDRLMTLATLCALALGLLAHGPARRRDRRRGRRGVGRCAHGAADLVARARALRGRRGWRGGVDLGHEGRRRSWLPGGQLRDARPGVAGWGGEPSGGDTSGHRRGHRLPDRRQRMAGVRARAPGHACAAFGVSWADR